MGNLWNRTIAWLTYRTILGRRRALLLFVIPGVLLLLAAAIRWGLSTDDTISAVDVSAGVLGGLVLGTVVPLLGLIVGTGVIAPEIDDGSIIYLLAKPVSRHTIVVTKFVIAVLCLAVFAAVPTFVTGVVLSGTAGGLPAGFAVGAFAASVAYAAVFVLLGVLTRHAVVVGLLYALLWESLVGNFVPGARVLSIQQWGLSITEGLTTGGVVEADVRLPVALAMLAVVTAGATWLAGRRLRSLTLVETE
jgi:ABC-2 type transport system permease protein